MITEGIRNRIPNPLRFVSGRKTESEMYSKFIDTFFDSRKEYDRYANEFEQGPTSDIRDEALEKYRRLTEKDDLYGIGESVARDYYTIVRKVEPTTVVETGVCNGVSTLSILLALQENEKGNLYSIDYPLKADESLDEFRQETFDNYGGAAIPRDKEPGWILPEELKSRWELTIGKSQRKLPQLVVRLGDLDLFIHDSEHSHPCMMFEYELGYEWLGEEGVILSDDISWNDAFSIFTDVREPEHGYLPGGVGYMKKSSGSV